MKRIVEKYENIGFTAPPHPEHSLRKSPVLGSKSHSAAYVWLYLWNRNNTQRESRSHGCLDGGRSPSRRAVLCFIVLGSLDFHHREPCPLLEAGSPLSRLVPGRGSPLDWQMAPSAVSSRGLFTVRGCEAESSPVSLPLKSQALQEQRQCLSPQTTTMCSLPCPTICDPMDGSPRGSSVYGIFEARTLEWVATPFSRDLPDPEVKPSSPMSPSSTGRFFICWTIREAPKRTYFKQFVKHL